MFKILKEKIKKRAGVPNIFTSLERLKKNGFEPFHILDIGAFEGEWSRLTSKIFPNSSILMFEALAKKKKNLDTLCSINSKLSYSINVLGSTTGIIQFSEIETASSVLEEKVVSQTRSLREMTTLNEELPKRNIQKVDLIKLDVQGYEMEILKGFSNYLPNTDVVLAEVSLLDLHKGVPLIREFLNFMYEYDFVVYDICSTDLKRPLDDALWQTDLMFVKENSVFRQDKRWN